MGAREVIELPRAYVEVEPRSGYLFIIESGQLSNLGEVRRYTSRLDAIARRVALDRALIDARGEVGEPTQDVREAIWHWLTRDLRPIQTIAFVLASDITIARVNMTALSRKSRLRAFDSVQYAQRWLLRDSKLGSATTLPALPHPSPSSPGTG